MKLLQKLTFFIQKATPLLFTIPIQKHNKDNRSICLGNNKSKTIWNQMTSSNQLLFVI